MASATNVVLVGACAVDTILIVPYFPNEDSKLRALSASTRRGGNCPNTLEVLHQLVQVEQLAIPSVQDGIAKIDTLNLMSTMPSKTSPTMPFIYDSFSITSKESKVDFSHCIYREDHVDPVSSYIISSQATGTRTIVNHNPLPEMTYKEFISTAESFLVSPDHQIETSMWFHFEGRIPDVTLACIKYLRHNWRGQDNGRKLTISVELEKPGREGLQDLAGQADVVFYSRSWAQGQGYTSSSDCLLQQYELLDRLDRSYARIPRTLICTWDKLGACGLVSAIDKTVGMSDVVNSPASIIANTEIVDSVGAGDTFIAGMLFGLINRDTQWSLEQKLAFANTLAGRKITQNGFSGLAERVSKLL